MHVLGSGTTRACDQALQLPSSARSSYIQFVGLSWYVEWKLWGSVDQIQAEFQIVFWSLLSTSFAYSPRAVSAERRLGPGCIQRLPEAQYQDELYRCCHAFSEVSLLTLPEFGMVKGRVDFYVPAKRWEIELLRDGDRLPSHWGRFSDGGSCHSL